jgi:hypothetical protein
MKRAICPACGTNYGVQLVWGKPSERDTYRASRGDAVLGGENAYASRADRHCRRCAHRWCADGSAPTEAPTPAQNVPLSQAGATAGQPRVQALPARGREAATAPVRWLPTLALFFVVWIFGLLLAGAVTCADGWASGSIGRHGACSHHGGVNTLPRALALLLALVVAIVFHKVRGRPVAKWKADESTDWRLPPPRG